MKQNINVLPKKVKKNVLENLKDPKTSIESSNNMQDFRKSIKEYNPCRKFNAFKVFDDTVAGIQET